MEKKSRIYSYDIIRIIAVLAVVTIHSSANLLTKCEFGSFNFTVGNLLDSISRLAVPLFLMISGALMLNEDRNIPAKKFFRSAANIYFLLLVWSALYAFAFKILYPIVTHKAINVKEFIKAFMNGHYHLWYLFMIVGLYLLTPVLRTFVKRDNMKIVGYLMLITAVIYLAPIFLNVFSNIALPYKNIIKSYSSNFKFTYTNEFLFYYLAGWFISNYNLTAKQRRLIYSGGVAGLIVTFVATQFYKNNTDSYTVFYSTAMLNVVIYAVAVFTFFHYLFKDKSLGKATKTVTTLSALTFGVYLIHPAFLFVIRELVTDKMTIGIGTYVIEFAGALILSFVSAFIMSKLPVIKKLIRC